MKPPQILTVLYNNLVSFEMNSRGCFRILIIGGLTRLDPFYRDRQWAHITDWKAELAPHYAQAKKMLGVATYPGTSTADELMKAIAEDYGVADTFHNADVGVLFGEQPGVEVPDPYFGGAGPARRASSCRGSR